MTNYSTTTRLGFRYPSDTPTPNVISDFAALMATMAGDLDTKLLGYSSGLDSALPAAGIANRVFKATDTGRLLADNGAAWDPLGLYVKLASGAITAKSGQWVVVQATGVTVTLPAAVANAMVRVTSVPGSPASPTTITAPGGASIYGQGTAPVASITLGQPYSSVLLQCDGANWAIVAGEQDTGWVTLTVGANCTGGFTTNSDLLAFPAPSGRRRGSHIELRGGVVTTGAITYPAALVTLPAGMRPAANIAASCAVMQGPPISGDIVIRPNGVVSSLLTTVASGTYYWFDGVSIPLV